MRNPLRLAAGRGTRRDDVVRETGRHAAGGVARTEPAHRFVRTQPHPFG
jgi:hypothetical protein